MKDTVASKAYWDWQKYVIREWQPKPGEDGKRQDKLKLAGFAITLASFGTSGKDIWPSAAKVAPCCEITPRTVQELRKRVTEQGLFKKIPDGKGGFKHHGRVFDLEIAYPGESVAEPVANATPAPTSSQASGETNAEPVANATPSQEAYQPAPDLTRAELIKSWDRPEAT